MRGAAAGGHRRERRRGLPEHASELTSTSRWYGGLAANADDVRDAREFRGTRTRRPRPAAVRPHTQYLSTAGSIPPARCRAVRMSVVPLHDHAVPRQTFGARLRAPSCSSWRSRRRRDVAFLSAASNSLERKPAARERRCNWGALRRRESSHGAALRGLVPRASRKAPNRRSAAVRDVFAACSRARTTPALHEGTLWLAPPPRRCGARLPEPRDPTAPSPSSCAEVAASVLRLSVAWLAVVSCRRPRRDARGRGEGEEAAREDPTTCFDRPAAFSRRREGASTASCSTCGSPSGCSALHGSMIPAAVDRGARSTAGFAFGAVRRRRLGPAETRQTQRNARGVVGSSGWCCRVAFVGCSRTLRCSGRRRARNPGFWGGGGTRATALRRETSWTIARPGGKAARARLVVSVTALRRLANYGAVARAADKLEPPHRFAGSLGLGGLPPYASITSTSRVRSGWFRRRACRPGRSASRSSRDRGGGINDTSWKRWRRGYLAATGPRAGAREVRALLIVVAVFGLANPYTISEGSQRGVRTWTQGRGRPRSAKNRRALGSALGAVVSFLAFEGCALF